MKKIFILSLFFVFIVGCSKNKTENEIPKEEKLTKKKTQEMTYCYNSEEKDEVWIYNSLFAKKIDKKDDAVADFSIAYVYRVDPYLINNPDKIDEVKCNWVYVDEKMEGVDAGELNRNFLLTSYWQEKDYKCEKQVLDLNLFKKPTEKVCDFDDLMKGF